MQDRANGVPGGGKSRPYKASPCAIRPLRGRVWCVSNLSGGSLRSPPAKHGSTPSGPQVLILLCPGLSTASCRNNRQKLRRESLHSAGVSCSIVLERLAPGVGRTVRRAGWGCNAFVASPCRSSALQAEGGTFCRGFLCLPGDKAYLCRRTTYKTFI